MALNVLTITRDQIAAAKAPPDGYPVPVLGHLPEGSVLVSSCYDPYEGELHILYRVEPKPELAPLHPILTAEAIAALEEEDNQPTGRAILAQQPMKAYALEQSARVPPAPTIESVAMVAHELVRAWRIATGKTPELRPWPDLPAHDRADAIDALRSAAVGVMPTHFLPPAQARVEQTLREVTLQAFSLKLP